MFENFTPLQLYLLKDGLGCLLSEHDHNMSQEEIKAANDMREAITANQQQQK